MRGLGIGIMVTALLMGVATGKGIPLSDAEIRAKALELGMVERDSLKLTDIADGSSAPSALPESGTSQKLGTADAGSNEDETNEAGEVSGGDSASNVDGTEGLENGTEAERQTGTEGSSETGALDAEEEPGPETPAGTEDGLEDSLDSENGVGSTADEAVRIVIEYGVTSDHVSEMLAEVGLVADAAAFDSYLCDNGLSRSITAGTYEIKPGTSEEEIIRIITKNR